MPRFRKLWWAHVTGQDSFPCFKVMDIILLVSIFVKSMKAFCACPILMVIARKGLLSQQILLLKYLKLLTCFRAGLAVQFYTAGWCAYFLRDYRSHAHRTTKFRPYFFLLIMSPGWCPQAKTFTNRCNPLRVWNNSQSFYSPMLAHLESSRWVHLLYVLSSKEVF